MKNPKIIYHISWIFALVSLVCIGFSTWNITNQVVESQSLAGSIKADNVINSSEYIEFSSSHGYGTGMECFYYTDTCFVQNDQMSTAGYVTAYYYLNTINCQELLKESKNNAVKVECTLTATDGNNALEIFSSISGVRTISADVEVDKRMVNVDITNQTSTSTSTSYTHNFIIENLLNAGSTDVFLTISFKFEVPPGTNFTNNFYNKLGVSPVFTFNTRISGVTV